MEREQPRRRRNDFTHSEGRRSFCGIFPVTVALLLLLSAACPGSSRAADAGAPSEWKIGYWFWQMYDKPYSGSAEDIHVDLLYVQTGSPPPCLGPDARGSVYMSWPDKLPGASEYFAVLRVEGACVPPEGLIPELTENYRLLKLKALKAGQRPAGLQIDFDCPTEKLAVYAAFLKKLREGMPKEDRLSITALLDWFRPGTGIAEVLERADEFVPQFYDTGMQTADDDAPKIAEAIDPARWAAVFNSFGRPYRIGIAVFGRTMEVDEGRRGGASAHTHRSTEVDGYGLMDTLRREGARLLSARHNKSGEKALRFVSKGEAGTAFDSPAWERTIEMILPTEESVSGAYRAVTAFGGHCGGAVFFRWPSADEALVLRPWEVRRIIEGKPIRGKPRIETEDGFCAAAGCADLYAIPGDRFSNDPVLLRIQSSMDLEYFIPEKPLKTAMRGPRTIEVRLAPYPGKPRVYLGRAVTRAPAAYTLEEQP